MNQKIHTISHQKLLLGKNFGDGYLTQRETEVLTYILSGYTAKRIAILLGVSHRTVENYAETLKIKFQCRSKEEVVMKAFKLGFVELKIGSVADTCK